MSGRSPEDFAQLNAFNRWANGQTLESCAALSPEELEREVGGSFGSILGTLTHLVGADWVWLERFHGRSPRSLSTGFGGLEELRSRVAEIERGQQSVLSSLTPERLAAKITYVNFAGATFSYTLADAMIHVVNHGSYHRGQIATMLRQLGKRPLSTDYLLYLDGQSARPASRS